MLFIEYIAPLQRGTAVKLRNVARVQPGNINHAKATLLRKYAPRIVFNPRVTPGLRA
jgi:hypothetical protein